MEIPSTPLNKKELIEKVTEELKSLVSSEETGRRGRSSDKKVPEKDEIAKIKTVFGLLLQYLQSIGEGVPSINNLGGDIDSIQKRLSTLENEMKEQKKEIERQKEVEARQKEQIRRQDDEIDEIQSRARKGNLIISSQSREGMKSKIMSDDELKSMNLDLTTHVLDLIKEKSGVTLPPSDIAALHRLKGGNIIVKIWNRAPNAAFWAIRESIFKPTNRSVNLYINFHLTNRRNGLLAHLRSLKREGKICRIFSNENGHLAFKINDEKNVWIDVTYSKKTGQECPKTLSTEEIDSIVSNPLYQ